ncbi:MAG: hypothetical protein AABZ23_05220 [Deltaproteobacteria bacterium]
MKTPSIKKGRIIIYRLFDAAQEINLAMIELKEKEGAKRLKLSKTPYMKAIEIANPPLSFDLKPFSKRLFDREVKIQVIAKAFDFGVISIAFDVPVPEGATFAELEATSRALEGDPSINEIAKEYVLQLFDSFGAHILSPEIKQDFIEDYLIFYIEELTGDVPGFKAQDFLRHYDAARLLLYEERDLSAFTRKETLRHCFSYYPDDLIIVHIDNALIIDPTGSTDMPDILEFANAQILELRYYDHVIDAELSWIYGELTTRGIAFFRLRKYEKIAKKITRILTEMTQITEKVNNALKVTEDIYYARIYRTFMSILRCREWEDSIGEKLRIITNTYKMLHDEISSKRTYVIELSILILIAIEFALVLLNE